MRLGVPGHGQPGKRQTQAPLPDIPVVVGRIERRVDNQQQFPADDYNYVPAMFPVLVTVVDRDCHGLGEDKGGVREVA